MSNAPANPPIDGLELLYTTRAMRRVAPDPIDDTMVADLLDAALRGPSGGNRMRVRFVVMRDPAKKAEAQKLYAEGMQALYSQPAGPPDPEDPAGPPNMASVKSAPGSSSTWPRFPF